jgi:hypothetical protein
MQLGQRAVTPMMSPETAFTWLDLDDITAEPLRAGVAWWRATRGERTYPAREELSPRQMIATLPYMSLLKVIDGGADFEHRIVGDVMVQAFNLPIQNRRFSAIAEDAPAFIASCFELFRKVVDTGVPLAWLSRSDPESRAIMFTQREIVLLPLGRGYVDHILGFGSGALPGTRSHR